MGLSDQDLVVPMSSADNRIIFPNLAGIELVLEVKTSFTPCSPPYAGIELPHTIFEIGTRNRTRNPLPVALAFSWQDLEKQNSPTCQIFAHGITLAFSSHAQPVINTDFLSDEGTPEDSLQSPVQLTAQCDQNKAHYSFCAGWNPDGSGEEVWDDFFASGELGDQIYHSYAGAIGIYCIAAAQQNTRFIFSLGQPEKPKAL